MGPQLLFCELLFVFDLVHTQVDGLGFVGWGGNFSLLLVHVLQV